VLRDVDIPNFTGLGMFVSESDVTSLAGDGNVSKTSEDFRYLSSGKRFPNHSLQKFWQFVVLVEVVRIDVHLCPEEVVRIVDRLPTPVFESEDFGQLCEGVGTSVSTPRETGLDIMSGHAPVIFTDEFHPIPLLVA
jgi:hypothetical protein